MAEILLVRHGETEWSRTGRHTGRSDVPLTEEGRRRAAALAPMLAGRRVGLALTSPLSRARDTARLAGVESPEPDPDLLEWDYGAWEGRTTAQIRQELGQPGWTVWSAPVPPGETPGEQPEDVAVRAGRVLARCAPVLLSGRDCVLVAHGHLLRILTATWLGLPARDARLFALDAGSLSSLGHEHETPVIRWWDVTPAALP